jgi:hypothetical protein
MPATQAEPRFTIHDAEAVELSARSPRSAGLAQAASAPKRPAGYTAAPASRGQRKSYARSYGENGDAGETVSDEEKGVFRLAEPPADVTPSVTVAQSFGLATRRPRVQTSAMQVVEIASTIAGVAMTRVVDNQGDVSWELDQMPKDAVHPGGASSSPGSGTWQTQTISVPGLRCENYAGQETFVDFEVNFKYNGASVGYIEVTTTKTGDAWGWGLAVKEGMTVDPNSYDTSPPSGQRFAAVKLRFHFRFDHTPLQDVLGYIDLTLYGNGAFAESSRWTQ